MASRSLSAASHSLSFDQRRTAREPRTAIASAFFYPAGTTSFRRRAIPVQNTFRCSIEQRRDVGSTWPAPTGGGSWTMSATVSSSAMPMDMAPAAIAPNPGVQRNRIVALAAQYGCHNVRLFGS